MTRKPRMATEDDQTRRFARERADDLRTALFVLRRAVAAYSDPQVPEILEAIEAIERSLQPKPRRSVFRR